jgi:hypothetical protein
MYEEVTITFKPNDNDYDQISVYFGYGESFYGNMTIGEALGVAADRIIAMTEEAKEKKQ